MKTYICLNKTFLHTFVVIDGKEVVVEFKGGSDTKPFKGGLLRTADKKIQKALEARPDYNIVFKLDPKQNAVSGKTTKSNDKGGDDNKGGNGDNEPTVFEEPTTIQQASEILNSEFQVPKSHCNTKAEVNAKCKELNVSFPNVELA